MKKEQKKAFNSACAFFQSALELKDDRINIGLAYASLITCIESMCEIEFKHENKQIEEECGSCHKLKKSHWTCQSCGSPMWGLRAKFREFLFKYGGTTKRFNKYANWIYDLRCDILHIGKILASTLETSVDIEPVIRTVRICLVNWLLESNKSKDTTKQS